MFNTDLDSRYHLRYLPAGGDGKSRLNWVLVKSVILSAVL